MIKEVIYKLFGILIKPKETISEIVDDGYNQNHSVTSIFICAIASKATGTEYPEHDT